MVKNLPPMHWDKGFPSGSAVKNWSAMQERLAQSLDRDDSPREGYGNLLIAYEERCRIYLPKKI